MHDKTRSSGAELQLRLGRHVLYYASSLYQIKPLFRETDQRSYLCAVIVAMSVIALQCLSCGKPQQSNKSE